jgi:hypothetical protein
VTTFAKHATESFTLTSTAIAVPSYKTETLHEDQSVRRHGGLERKHMETKVQRQLDSSFRQHREQVCPNDAHSNDNAHVEGRDSGGAR